jgi:Flp pilus assembly protein TadG
MRVLATRARRRARTQPRLRSAWRDDRGQIAVEFTAMAPIILATLIVLWQAVLIGYTFMLAGNAADQAVHAGAEADPWKNRNTACRTAGEQDLPTAWRDGADIGCYATSDLVRAHADIKVPLLFPGFVNIPLTIPGTSAAARES